MDKPSEHYEKFWDDTSRFIEARIAAGEVDPLAIVIQIHTEKFRRLHDAVRRSATRGHETDLASITFQGVSFGKVITVPSMLIEREFFLYDLVERCLDDEIDTVVEFGSGFGRNLFWLDAQIRTRRPNLRYIACELTSAGRACTQKLAALRPEMKIEVIPFDFNNPDFSFLSDIRAFIGMSVASIEQISDLSNAFHDGLLSHPAKVSFCHYEPVGWQRHPELLEAALRVRRASDEKPLLADCVEAIGKELSARQPDHGFSDLHIRPAAYAIAQNYNTNLVAIIQRLAQAGQIEMTYQQPDIWGPASGPNSLIGWRKN